MPSEQRKLLIISAPSGAGKSTLVKSLMEEFPELAFSVSACNRAPRKGEVEGKDYYFLTTQEFQESIRTDQFVEWEEVYEGRYYGTLRSELERVWENNKVPIFDIDVAGGTELKKLYGNSALTVFIDVPSIEVLKERLQLRGTESRSELSMRLGKAENERATAHTFDTIVVNDQLATAKEELRTLVSKFLEK